MATLITSKPSMMSFPSSLNRMGTFPIDLSSVWYSYEDAVAYATQNNFTPTYQDQTGLPYVGQILTVVETAEDGTTSVTAYSIQNEAGDLAQVGTVTLTDEASIHKDDNDQISIYNFIEEGQEENKFPIVLKDEDGTFRIHWTSFDEKSIFKNENGEIEIDGFKAANNITYPRKSADGKLEWVTISEVVEGATSDTVTTGDNKSIVTKEISGDNEDVRYEASIKNYDTADAGATNDYVPFKDATNGIAWKQVYTKSEVYNKEEVENKIDEKLISVFKFKGVKTYKSELPTTGQAIGDVWLVIYDGDAPAEGETNTLPVSNSEYVWTSEKKWENLGDDIVDLSNYYTKTEVNEELAKKGAVDKVEDGVNDWTVKVTDAGGNVTHAKAKVVNASNEAAGLVKGDGTNVSIADGVITVNEAGHAAEATHATNADNATKAGHAGHAATADYAGRADNADKASHAATADYATEAGKVTNALKIKINGETTYSFDGSTADVTVPLDNYYTKSEADNNFMSETETNEAIAAVTNPLAEAVEAIKGEIPEEEDYTLPTLVEIKAKNEAQDTAIQGLTTQVETANSTANAANTTAGEAKTKAEAAESTANTANKTATQASEDAAQATQTANNAKTKAEEAVGTANTASGVANEAKTTAEGAVSTANTANAQATANKSAIEALQAEDTTIKGLVTANTSKVTNLENTVAAGLADRYTKAETNTYVAEQIAAIDHLKREVVESLPGTPDANTIYMVPNAEIIEKTFSGTTAEGIPADQTNKMYHIFINGLTFTIVYDGVKYSKVKAIQNASVENDGYEGYLATFGEHSLRYAFGSFKFDTADSTSYTITLGDYPEDNYYVEWMYINNKWERIGTTTTDLVNYVTKDGAIDNTTVGGVKVPTAIANAAKTAEWSQISNKPKTATIEIPAGSTSVVFECKGENDGGATREVINYKAYLLFD